jgi:hypothetical protein
LKTVARNIVARQPYIFSQNKSTAKDPAMLNFCTNSFPEEKLYALPQLEQDPCQHRVNVCVVPEIREH